MRKTIMLLLVLGGLCGHLQAQTSKDSAKAFRTEAKKWFRQKEWLGAISIKPSKSINAYEFYRQYKANKPYWDKAFAFLRQADLKDLKPGRQDLDGDNVFITVTEGPTKDYEQTKFESHRKYVDLQYVVNGEELIEASPVAASTITKPYDEKNDIANYTAKGKQYKATPAIFFIFFPTDAHRPGITPGGNKMDKKLVIKIRAAG